MTYLKHIFTPEETGTAGVPISDWSELYSGYRDTHLRQSALDTVVGKIVNASSLVNFISSDKGLNYRLNVIANDNMSAIEFRTKLINTLIFEGECLAIKINDKLYIADSFTVDKQKELDSYWYKNIVIGNLTLNKSYRADEVFHFKYYNENLKKFLDQLNDSYAALFKRLFNIHMREQQLRIFAQFKFLKNDSRSQDQQLADFKKYLENLRTEIESHSVAILPRQLDYDIEERSQQVLGRSVTELGDLENMYVKQVANALQVPPLLFSGDLADISQHMEAFIKFCIRPLMQVIVNEINAKYFTKEEEARNEILSVNTIGLIYNSELEMAKEVRTMIESAIWTIDDINEILGKPKENTPLTTRRYITRNMAPLNEDGSMQMK